MPKRDEVRGSGGNYIMRSLMMCNPTKYPGDQIEKNEMDGHAARMADRSDVYKVWGGGRGELREREYFEDPSVNGG
jgi:hypothetical protein